MTGAKITETAVELRLPILRTHFPAWDWQREVSFHPSRKWRFDYASERLRIALEIEGGVYGRGQPCPTCGRRKGGAHSSVQGMLRDIEKYNEAAALGWRVLRFTPDQFAKFGMVERLLNQVASNDKLQNAETGRASSRG